MNKIIFALVVVLAIIQAAMSAYCSGSPAPGERVSNFPIYDGKLRFKKQVKNAMLFEAGPLNNSFPVVHLWGTPYEIGYAQGTLIRAEVVEFVTKTWNYLAQMLVEELDGDKLPLAVKELLVQKGIDRALDWTAEVTAPFTSQDYYDEVRGLADATGLSYDLLYRLQMFPEMSKAACSFFGAWGESVKTAGHTYQLRALDYDVDGPFRDYPQVTVYHPNNGHAFAQVGWPGSIGALTGMSSQQLSISEIGVSFPDDSFEQGTPDTKPEKVKGQPWMFVLRDVLQFEDSLEGAENRVANANRTCNLIIGLGDGEAGKVVGTQYSGYVSNFYDDTNQLPVNDTWHPRIKDVVYNGMDWNCPSYTNILGQQLQKYYGQIDENVVVKNVLPTVQTGNLHAAIYDLTDMNMHVSFCRKSADDANPDEPHYAYERQFVRLHMKEIFAQQAPQV